MERLHACTVVARHDAPGASVLADSFLEHHPGGSFTVLVTDDVEDQLDASGARYELVRPADLGLPPGELERLALVHDEPGLTDALTPRLLRRLLGGAESVLLLAPDVEVYAPLTDVGALAREHGIVVLPRAGAPMPRDGKSPDEAELLAVGALDPGCVGIGAGARPFLDWWQDRAATPPRDGRVLDLAVEMFGAHVLRDSSCNVAVWNLHDRALRRAGSVTEVDGRPLRTFRFEGYDPDRPHMLSARLRGVPRVRLRDDAVLARLSDDHAARLRAAGAGTKAPPYAFGVLPDGSAIDARMRRLAAEALAAGGTPPNPFVAGAADAFVDWLDEPVFPSLRPVVSRYLARLWHDHEDLQRRYPSVVGESAEHYLEWVMVLGGDEHAVPVCVRPTPDLLARLRSERRRARPRRAPAAGVNIVGYLDAIFGVGEVARLLTTAVTEAGVPHAAVNHLETISRHTLPFASTSIADAPFDVNLLCVNAAQTVELAEQLGPERFAGRRTVGLWFWEVEAFELPVQAALDLVDEIWVASDFTRDALQAVCDRPVRTVPVPVVARTGEATRTELGVPENAFMFLFTFDYLSVPRRKNAVGLIEAYTRAFQPTDGAVLVVKSINGDKRPAAVEEVLAAATGRGDVIVIDAYLSAEHQASLLTQCDACVSLHRSEGYGLSLAEALVLGKPVIATGYSGNLAFMDEQTSYLVDYELRPIGPDADPYPPEGRWAEPDLDHAAALMRAVFDDPDAARARARPAAARLSTTRSPEAVGRVIAGMLEEVRRGPESPSAWRPFFMRGWRSAPDRVRNEPARRYGYDWLADGTPVDATMQRLLGGDAPDPDHPGAFVAWLNQPVVPARHPVVSRYLHEFWRGRPDLQRHFPDLDRSCVEYLAWLVDRGWEETDIPYTLLPDVAVLTRARDEAAVPKGPYGAAYRILRRAYRTALRRDKTGW